MKVLGKRKPAWSRTAPIVYGAVPLQCANANLPDVFHGSQWASLHRPLVEHMVRHPLAQKVLTALEHTLLPDEALLQTIAALNYSSFLIQEQCGMHFDCRNVLSFPNERLELLLPALAIDEAPPALEPAVVVAGGDGERERRAVIVAAAAAAAADVVRP